MIPQAKGLNITVYEATIKQFWVQAAFHKALQLHGSAGAQLLLNKGRGPRGVKHVESTSFLFPAKKTWKVKCGDQLSSKKNWTERLLENPCGDYFNLLIAVIYFSNLFFLRGHPESIATERTSWHLWRGHRCLWKHHAISYHHIEAEHSRQVKKHPKHPSWSEQPPLPTLPTQPLHCFPCACHTTWC